jgi:citrate lyase subunit beta/citryl-CoA lyase
MRNLAETGRKYGFDGATCIHPSVVPILNEAFVPSAEEIGKACEIVEAARSARAAGKGAFTLHGRMIDPPIVKRAELLLVRAEGSQNAPWN